MPPPRGQPLIPPRQRKKLPEDEPAASQDAAWQYKTPGDLTNPPQTTPSQIGAQPGVTQDIEMTAVVGQTTDATSKGKQRADSPVEGRRVVYTNPDEWWDDVDESENIADTIDKNPQWAGLAASLIAATTAAATTTTIHPTPLLQVATSSSHLLQLPSRCRRGKWRFRDSSAEQIPLYECPFERVV
jgi:hypothetical protein